MPGRGIRWSGIGLLATCVAGTLGLTAMMNSASAHADGDDIGLVVGASGLPIPGPFYVWAADTQYLDNKFTQFYPDLTFYQATPDNIWGNGLFTPEGLYPLTSAGVHQLFFNYPLDSDGFPSLSSSAGQGMAIVESAIAADQAAGDESTIFGYSQSSTIAGLVMQQLDPSGTPQTGPLDPQFLLVADPSNPNGGALERFNGFETLSGHTTVDPLNLPSLGFSFDGATPADDYITHIYSLEYDGFTDFPRYPLNLLADINAFLGIGSLHGTYLNGFIPGEGGPTAAEIADATLLPGSMDSPTDPCADCLTNYYMIDETPPLVSLLPKSLQDLLGPDLTYLINLGYGDGSQGYAVTPESPADVPTPFGLFPDVSMSTVLSTLVTDTQEGITALENDPTAFTSSLEPVTSLQSLDNLISAFTADAANPAATFTDFVNALSTAASDAYSVLLPTADVINALVTSIPAYDASLFTDNLSTGDYLDAIGLPIAANTGIDTLLAGFELAVIDNAANQIADAFSGLF